MRILKRLLCVFLCAFLMVGCAETSVQDIAISEPVYEPEAQLSDVSNILLVGNSFTFRKSTGYGVYSVLREIVNANRKGSDVDKFVHEGCSIVQVAEKYMDDLKKRLNQKEYGAIVLQGPLRGRYTGVFCDEMKDASVKIAEAVLSSKSSKAKIYFLSTHGYHVVDEVADFDDEKTQGLAKGWKRLSQYVNKEVKEIRTEVIYGGYLEGIFDKQTGISVVCGNKGDEYDRHPSWFGAYCLAAAVYTTIYDKGFSELFDYENSIENEDEFRSIVGVGKGNGIKMPNHDDMILINQLAEGSAIFEKSVVEVDGTDATVENYLYCYTDGKVSYRSSDESVATVNEDGTIDLHKKGTATITAFITATNQFNETDANYLLKVK